MRVSHNFRTKLLVLLAALALLYSGVLGFSIVSVPMDKTDLLVGITFAGSTTDADMVYLQNSLYILRDNLPEWYAYVADSKPFVVSVGQTDDEGWVVAKTTCCDDQGNGRITFDDHLGTLAASSDPEDQTTQARQVAFLSALVHEVTHLRDYRAGRIPAKMDATVCIASEGAAYAKEFEFKRAVVSAKMDGDRSGELYRRAAEKQLAEDEHVFSGNFWKLYCILAHPNVMDD